MKLVTYDRGGHRRLGALLGEKVVDLPDLVGHPAFPTSMEALVARNGGTVLEAAQAALEAEDREEFVVPGARLLVPLLPASIRHFLAFEDHAKAAAARRGEPVADAWYEMPLYRRGNARALLGPGEELPWPPFSEHLDYEVEVAAVAGRYGRDLDPPEAAGVVFGYTLATAWTARDLEAKELAGGLGPGKSRDFATSLGPCLVTADEIDPRTLDLVVRVDGDVWSEGSMREARWSFPDMVAHVSRGQDVAPGDVLASGTFGGGCGADLGRRLPPGAVVEVEAPSIGMLANRVGGRSPRPGG